VSSALPREASFRSSSADSMSLPHSLSIFIASSRVSSGSSLGPAGGRSCLSWPMAAAAGPKDARAKDSASAVVSLLIVRPLLLVLVVRLLLLFELRDERLHELAQLPLLVGEPLELGLLRRA